jgi:hypothetical protein
VLTVCYEDPADKPWAIDTWKSTFRPPEEDEDEQ